MSSAVVQREALDEVALDARPGDLLSPELALVDPELAARARKYMAAPVEPLSAWPRAAPSPAAPAAREVPRVPTILRPPAPETPAPPPPSRRSRRGVLLLGGAAALVVASAGLAVHELLRGTPQPKAPPRVLTATSPSTPSAVRRKTQRAKQKPRLIRSHTTTGDRRKPRPGTQKSSGTSTNQSRASHAAASAPPAEQPFPPFSWVAIPKATSYDFALFRGAERVFVSHPRLARIAVPTTWRYADRTFTLTPGTYRWVVRPVFGKALGTAIVNAKLVVS